MKVRYSPQARNDLQDIFQYLHDRSPSGAANVMRAIYAGIEFLPENPMASQETGSAGDSCKDRASVQFQDLL
jgi:toxin ParE1/3/4